MPQVVNTTESHEVGISEHPCIWLMEQEWQQEKWSVMLSQYREDYRLFDWGSIPCGGNDGIFSLPPHPD